MFAIKSSYDYLPLTSGGSERSSGDSNDPTNPRDLVPHASSKAAEFAEGFNMKMHGLAEELAKRHEEKEECKRLQMAQRARKDAEYNEMIDAATASVQARDAQRQKDYKEGPTIPRNVEWKRQQEKKELLKNSFWARVLDNAETVVCGLYLYGLRA